MPFVGLYEGKKVTTEEVSTEDRVCCLECGEEFGIRERHERDGLFVARHFWHPQGSSRSSGSGGCSGGESDLHRRLKSITLSKLKHKYRVKEAGLEKKIGENIADVYAIFEEPLERLGRGMVVEIQYRNEGKDTESVTRNYLGNQFSVCWVDQSNIEGKDIELENIVHHWWGSDYQSDVLQVFHSIDHQYRFGNHSEGVVRVGEPDRDVNYRDIELDTGLGLETVVDICRILSKHGIIELDSDGIIHPIIRGEHIDYTEEGREKMRQVMSEASM